MFPEGEGAESEQSEDSVMELSQNLFGVDCLCRVDYMKWGGLHKMGRIFSEMGWIRIGIDFNISL